MITNNSKIISKEEKYCHSIWSKAHGLMFSKKRNLVMVFNREQRIQLHNFFVFFPIDVVVLDKDKKVVEIKRNFRPFTFWNSKQKGKYLIEFAFPAEYKLGDILKILKK
jgi:uncharacterized membrane protein (UPF0127 family)